MGEVYYLDAYRPLSPALIQRRAERLQRQVEADQAAVLDALREIGRTAGVDQADFEAAVEIFRAIAEQLDQSIEACRQAAARGGRP